MLRSGRFINVGHLEKLRLLREDLETIDQARGYLRGTFNAGVLPTISDLRAGLTVLMNTVYALVEVTAPDPAAAGADQGPIAPAPALSADQVSRLKQDQTRLEWARGALVAAGARGEMPTMRDRDTALDATLNAVYELIAVALKAAPAAADQDRPATAAEAEAEAALGAWVEGRPINGAAAAEAALNAWVGGRPINPAPDPDRGRPPAPAVDFSQWNKTAAEFRRLGALLREWRGYPVATGIDAAAETVLAAWDDDRRPLMPDGPYRRLANAIEILRLAVATRSAGTYIGGRHD